MTTSAKRFHHASAHKKTCLRNWVRFTCVGNTNIYPWQAAKEVGETQLLGTLPSFGPSLRRRPAVRAAGRRPGLADSKSCCAVDGVK